MSTDVSFKNLCLCVTRVDYLSGFVEFLCLKPKRSTRHGRFDGEGGTLKCFHMWSFLILQTYICVSLQGCVREKDSAYLTVRITFQGPISPLCVCTVQRFCLRSTRAAVKAKTSWGKSSAIMTDLFTRWNFMLGGPSSHWWVSHLSLLSAHKSWANSNQPNSSLLLTLSESVIRGRQRRCLMIQDMRKGIQAVKCDFSDKHFKTNSRSRSQTKTSRGWRGY